MSAAIEAAGTAAPRKGRTRSSGGPVILMAGLVLIACIAADFSFLRTSYAERLAQDRSYLSEMLGSRFAKELEQFQAQLRALEGLYMASREIDAGELFTFTEFAVKSEPGADSVHRYGWIPDGPRRQVLAVDGTIGGSVVDKDMLGARVTASLDDQKGSGADTLRAIPGGVLAARNADPALVTLLHPVGLDTRYSTTGAKGVLFLTFGTAQFIENLGLPASVKDPSLAISPPPLPLPAEPGPGGNVQPRMMRVSAEIGAESLALDYWLEPVSFRAHFLERELGAQLYVLGGFLFLSLTMFLNFRQIRLGQAAAARAAEAAGAAEQSNYQKTRFLATMSHEMRTPLNGIIGMSDLLRNSGLNEEQAKYAQTLSSSAEGLLALINQILDFSKIEAQNIELDPQEANLGDIVTEVANAANVLAADKGVELVLSLPMQACIPVMVDGFKLRQVLTNLVSNAVKFTSEGSVTIGVVLKKRLPDGESVFEFSVADTGIGIEQDRLDAIFEPFQQADISTTRNFGGTGLGLSITREIVSAMGSRVAAESTPGRGSRFSFELTLKGDNFNRPQRRKSCFLGIHNILLYAPESPQRDAAVTAIETAGAEVRLAEDLASAEEMLHQALEIGDPIDLILVPDAAHAGELQRFREHPGDGAPTRIGILRSSRLTGRAVTPKERDMADFLIQFPHTAVTVVDRVYHALSRRADMSDRRRPPKEDRPVRFDGLRVLLVDDDQVNQIYGRAALEGLGCDVTSAWNGQEALSAIAADPKLEIVFLDCQMPVMDGLEAAEKLRYQMENRIIPEIPVLALTANAQASDRQACLKAGMDDFMTKPVRREDLVRAIQNWLPDWRGKDLEPAADTAPSAEPVPERAAERTTPADVPPNLPAEPVHLDAAGNAAEPQDIVEVPGPADAARTGVPDAPPGADAGTTVSRKSVAFDRKILMETKGLLGDGFGDFLRSFISSTQASIQSLGTDIRAKEFDIARRTSHNLKSSCKMVGAMQMADVMRDLEEELKKVAPSMNRVGGLLSEARAAYKSYLVSLRQN
ncbi:hybrid sensor histidine kinase/response regulator [Mangrovicoccus ximenensis]|uniref:hybrid sensor histidine kinase/response regulator n=1 Tax=Mangrovicoccus ximenensis TaxID=1911570 RepID=UPI0011AE3868|nr:hybrid sensor histidine kinase/response regulator [Mangrovicoccus ximenensis]